MLRIAIALMAGVGLAITFGRSSFVLMAMIVVLAIAVTAAMILNTLKDSTLTFRYRYLQGYSLVAAIVASGYVLAWLHVQSNYNSHFSHFIKANSVLLVCVDEPPVERQKVYVAAAKVLEVENDSSHIKTTGYLQLSFKKDSLNTIPRYGDVLLIKGRVDSLEAPQNPGEFNYKRYLSFHNLYQKIYLQNENWQKVDSVQGSLLLATVYSIRNSFLQIIRRYVTDKNDFGVASAIMLGYRDYQNGEITRAYAASGALHVLSVSGLHVAIMFLMLNFLLQGMDGRGKKMEISKALIIILFIWFYACLTGMSPPVMRSALMFTLIQIGNVLVRNANIYNIIAGSAVLQMLFDPFVMMDVGFELSYIAVIGIIYLYPKISMLVVFKIQQRPENILSKPAAFLRWVATWLLDWVWQLAAVSIAAQIATLPLCLLYFYQFPNLFIISNLVVIPMSDLVLFSGTALCAVGHIPYLNAAAGWIFNGLIHVLDKFIFWVGHLPYALTHALCIGPVEMVLMYLLIFLLCWLTVEKKVKILLTSLGIVVVLCSFNSYRSVRNAVRKELVVYSVPKQKAIAFITAKKLVYDFDNSLWNDTDEMAFHIWHHWADCGINSETPIQNSPINYRQLAFGKYATFNGTNILIIDSSIAEINTAIPVKLKADVIVISCNPAIRIADLQKLFDFKQLVFDSSNKKETIKNWKMDCKELHLSYYDVAEKGAFILDF